jgi:hypothetical protein
MALPDWVVKYDYRSRIPRSLEIRAVKSQYTPKAKRLPIDRGMTAHDSTVV